MEICCILARCKICLILYDMYIDILSTINYNVIVIIIPMVKLIQINVEVSPYTGSKHSLLSSQM